ncbi:MAG TPA: peptidyl-prolyl cis-trans isomerase [Dokdonella sp.]
MKPATTSPRTHARAVLFLCTLSVVALAGCAGHGDGAAGTGKALGGPTVATVNGEPVPQALLDAFARARGIDLSKPQMRERALNQLTEFFVLEQAAKKAGYLDDPQFAAAAELGRLQGIAQATAKEMQKDDSVDDAAVRAEYDRQSAAGGAKEYDFGQLVFANQEDAKKAATEVAGGKPFDQVMEAHRKDARLARNFPKVRAQQLPPPLATALDGLKPGETTKTPVQLPQGWTVVHLNTVNTATLPPFDQVKENIRRTLARRTSEERLSKLRAEAKIVVNDAGTPPAQSPAPGATPAPAPAPTTATPAAPATPAQNAPSAPAGGPAKPTS